MKSPHLASLPMPQRVSELLGLEDYNSPLSSLVVTEDDGLMTLHEWASGVLANATLDDLELARSRFMDLLEQGAPRSGRGSDWDRELTEIVDVFFAAGLGYEQMARYICLGTALPYLGVLSRIVRGCHKSCDIFAVLHAEAELREGVQPQTKIIEETGLSKGAIYRLARRIRRAVEPAPQPVAVSVA